MTTFNLTATELKDLMTSGDIQLIDVREANEWAGGHIDGAVPCALSAIEAGEIPPEADGKSRILYCLGGVRSLKATQALQARGITVDHHLEGGIRSWVAAGFDVV